MLHTCVATGNPPGSLEWTVESGVGSAAVKRTATGSTLTLDSVQLTDSGNYTCIASNLYGSEASHATQLIVNGIGLYATSLLFQSTARSCVMANVAEIG